MTSLTTPLHALHLELGAKMVPFAGYDMPVQYSSGIIKEHLHTRAAAGLFDVSHMGQILIEGQGAAAMLERLLAADIEGLAIGSQTYALFTNESGGVLDDLMIARWSDTQFFLVVNAACKEQDMAHLRHNLTAGVTIRELAGQSLLALQGPKARTVMRQLCPAAADLLFMRACHSEIDGTEVYITCGGYTGEDGFEISLAGELCEALTRKLLEFDEVQPIGLGARDSLRLEAGLCLYGHELTEQINPVQAGLNWSIAKARRADGARPGGFPGAALILAELARGAALRRVGLLIAGKRPVRDGQRVLSAGGHEVGTICSAAYGATVGGPIAMAYVSADQSAKGTQLTVDVRGKPVSATVVAMPFIAALYYRG